MLGVVLQDTFIFSGNVADNLKLNSNLETWQAIAFDRRAQHMYTMHFL